MTGSFYDIADGTLVVLQRDIMCSPIFIEMSDKLLHSNQSAYRTETTLVDIHPEIARALESGKTAFLVLIFFASL